MNPEQLLQITLEYQRELREAQARRSRRWNR
jgi:hypothetical protein